jgi:hypothetical protein
MRVFISWSGDLSHSLALALRDWLPSVIQSIEPYVSSEDTYKGARWTSDIVRQFQESRFGILCITPQNLEAPWISFEAGALSNTVEKTHVCPYLLGVKKSQLSGPLLLFQAALCDENDTRRLIYSINNSPDGPNFEEKRLDSTFDVWWPKLDRTLQTLRGGLSQQSDAPPKAEEPLAQMLEEILDIVRVEAKFMHNPDQLLPPQYLRSVIEATLGKSPSSLHVDPSSPAWHDLRTAIGEAKALILDSREGRDVGLAAIEKVFSRLVDPLEYLCDRVTPRSMGL